MALKLMYITNKPEVATIAENSGVDRIFIDMEYIGKEARQGGMNTVQNHHTIEDIKAIRDVIKKAELLVRCNPIHYGTESYSSSEEEINSIIENGADIVMLPYFKTVQEVGKFITIVGGRVKTMLLLETPEAADILDDILDIPGIDYIHIGINDMSLGMGKKFMFELLADGTVEMLCSKIKKKGIPYGFGGIASLGKGIIPSENIIMEHYRLGSTCAILSRSFCNYETLTLPEVSKVFIEELIKIRRYEYVCQQSTLNRLEENKKEVAGKVKNILR